MKITVSGDRAAYDSRMREAEIPSYEAFIEAFINDRRGDPRDLNAFITQAQAVFSKRPRRIKK